ncbi:MAG TPA: hypothetical protein VD794_02590 [Flavisolibacter sp.]|nr:hypothetical protein [Flavisolibacter sp.]
MKLMRTILLANLFIGTTVYSQPTSTPYTTLVKGSSQYDTALNDYTNEVVASYDTTYEPKTIKTLVKTERKEVLVFDKNQRVHSLTHTKKNKAFISFTLPQPQTSNNKTTTVVAWAYWVSVNEDGAQAWQQNVQMLSKLSNGITSSYTTPLGALAIGAVPDLMVPTTGEDVYYAITNEANKDLFLIGKHFRLMDQGKGRAGYKKFTDKAQCQGTYFLCLANDNTVIPVSVNIKVVAIVETNYYEHKTDTEQKLTPR